MENIIKEREELIATDDAAASVKDSRGEKEGNGGYSSSIRRRAASDKEHSVPNRQCSCNLHVDYDTEELAQIVLVTLSVDPELKPDKVKREITVEGKRLLVSFTATEATFLRASFSSFMDSLVLATRTIEELGPGTEFMP